eukprot:Tbor_TRINITY_DN8291_c0_g1::TRINITY_DN8291_c0_g1_i1::g.15426::m.15426
MIRLSLLKRGNAYHKVTALVGDRTRSAKLRLLKSNNRGVLSDAEKGSTFTDPGIYRNTTDPNVMERYAKKINFEKNAELKNKAVGTAGVSDATLMGFMKGSVRPTTPTERSIANMFDEEALQLDESSQLDTMYNRYARKKEKQRLSNMKPLAPKVTAEMDSDGGGLNSSSDGNKPAIFQGNSLPEYSSKLHRSFNRESPAEYRQRFLGKHGVEPTEVEFKGLMRRLAAMDEADDRVERIQKRLVEDHGLYPSQRMDAYMLGDESTFPPWVHKLHSSVRDRVKYGGMGLEEEDEVMRIRLARMPIDARRAEWGRLKAAKQYEAGIGEQKISPRDLRETRLANRRHSWLQRKRTLRANILRRVALRAPDQHHAFPTHQVDFSLRLATIAQCVQNGVDTKGQWPIDQDELQKSKIRKAQMEAERIFLQTDDERRMLKSTTPGGAVDAGLASAINSLESRKEKEKKVHLTRKGYALRINSVKQGVANEKGQSYKDLALHAFNNRHPASNETSAASYRNRVAPRVYMGVADSGMASMSGWSSNNAAPLKNFNRSAPKPGS